MQLQRNEVMTGLLVVGTIAVITAVLILLGAPGLFRPLITYKIYFDNAGGIKQGAPVMLAGRKIGQVQKLYSPVSAEEDRRAQEVAALAHPPDPKAKPPPPDGKPKFEVRVDVQVDRSARVYRDAKTRLMQLGLLGEMAIDITHGTEASARARDGEVFAGERTPDFSEAASKLVEVIQPVATEATTAMKDLEITAQNINHLTDQSSELNLALGQFKTFGEHLVDLTAPDGPLNQSLENVRKLSDSLTEGNNIEVTLRNFRESSEKLKSTMRDIEPVGRNIAEFSDTIKTQPWRLIWPSTKKSPNASPTPGEQTITVRKSARAQKSTKAQPSPSRARPGGSR
jgi:ABC-type transporter Mla subunit MlaD